MCGIIGYAGTGDLRQIVRRGLKSLEYRGYDSCGYAFYNAGEIAVRKEIGKGKIKLLADSLPENVYETPACVISHTRWATHGANTFENAHPHSDCGKNIFLVHNGIIENYVTIKKDLGKNHSFSSSTDTEVICHVLEGLDYVSNPGEIFRIIEGSFACAFLDKRFPEKIFAFRKKSPLLAGKNGKGLFISSDAQALSEFCGDIAEFQENCLYEISATGIKPVHEKEKIKWFSSGLTPSVEQHGEEKICFMEKEIREQPDLIENNTKILKEMFFPREPREDAPLGPDFPSRIIIAGCGTSWHAGLIGKIYFERLAGISTQVEYASRVQIQRPCS